MAAIVPGSGILTALARGLSAKSGPPLSLTDQTLQTVDTRGGWFPIIRESATGDWQRGIQLRVADTLSCSWVFGCISLIASDIAKLCIDLRELQPSGVWQTTTSPSFSPVLAKPNGYQNRIQFYETWVISKLSRGNTYVLKERDARNVVVALHVLHPDRVKPLVSEDGGVYYQLMRDNLAGVGEPDPEFPAIPASEIIHDRWNCLYHPLVGIAPLYACGLPALQAIRIQEASARFFKNGARPGGILVAPAAISDDTAKRLKEYWDDNFTGENSGKVAVVGDGLKFESLVMKAEDAQLIEQLKWSAETVCGVYRVPSYKLNVGPVPLNNNVEALEQAYFSQALQIHIESIELCLDEGLALPDKYAAVFDLDGLLRMDQATQITTLAAAVGGTIMASNEARLKLNLPPVKGGDVVLSQQQNYSLAALDQRDRNDPFAKPTPAPPPTDPAANDDVPDDQAAAAFEGLLRRAWRARKAA